MRELRDGAKIHHVPRGLARVGFRIVALTGAVERRIVRVCLPDNLADADDRRSVGSRVVVEDAVADPHRVTHEIPGGKVPYAVPVRGLVVLVEQIVEGEDLGLRFDEPIPCFPGRAGREGGVPGAGALFLRRFLRGFLGGLLFGRHGQRYASRVKESSAVSTFSGRSSRKWCTNPSRPKSSVRRSSGSFTRRFIQSAAST